MEVYSYNQLRLRRVANKNPVVIVSPYGGEHTVREVEALLNDAGVTNEVELFIVSPKPKPTGWVDGPFNPKLNVRWVSKDPIMAAIDGPYTTFSQETAHAIYIERSLIKPPALSTYKRRGVDVKAEARRGYIRNSKDLFYATLWRWGKYINNYDFEIFFRGE